MAVQSVADITQSILNQLQTSDPSASAEIGTPEREFIEAIAEVIAAAQVDFSVLDSQNDLDTMTGSRLESWANLFGFQRQQAIAAAGTVTFFRNSAATEDIIIPIGTQVTATAADPNFPNVTFITTQTVTLITGDTEVDAPVQAALPGTIGNVPANSVTGFASIKTIVGIVGIRNDAAMAGGADAEDDDNFRVRLKNSIFRNMAGTYDQYGALSLSQPNVTKVVVLGPVSRYQEYMQVPETDDTVQRTDSHDGHSSDDKNYDPGSGGATDDATGTNWPHKRTTALSSIPYSQYTYNSQFYVIGPDGTTFLRPDVDFVFNRKPIDPAVTTNHVRHFSTAGLAAHQPDITLLSASVWPRSVLGLTLSADDPILVEHAYISSNSRNSMSAGILNAVDIFINGSSEKSVKSAEVFPPAANNLQGTNNQAWTYQHPAATTVINFKRSLDGSSAVVGSRILPLFWQPVMSIPSKFTVKNTTDSTVYTFLAARYKVGGQYYYDLNADGSGNHVANYFQVYESNGYYGTVRARDGIEIRTGVNAYTSALADGGKDGLDVGFVGSQIIGSVSYTYDQNVGAIQAIVEKNKQITTDVLVHHAKNRYFSLNITIMYSVGATRTVVNSGIIAAIASFFDNQYFGATIQLSDMLQVIHNVPGVDNVRWTHDVTVGTHKVIETFADGSATGTTFDNDFYLQDNELAASPSATQVTIQIRAQNTWSS